MSMNTRLNHRLSLSGVLLWVVLVSGCVSGTMRDDQHTLNGARVMHTIQVLYFDGCPNTPPVIEAARAVAEDLGEDWEVEMIDLESLPQRDTRRGYGSPTILFEDRDLFGLPEPTSGALSCRHYPGGNPTRASIRSALGR